MSYNQVSENRITVYSTGKPSTPYGIMVGFDEEFLSDLKLDSNGQVNTYDLVEHWLATLNAAGDDVLDHKVGPYTIRQLIFDINLSSGKGPKK